MRDRPWSEHFCCMLMANRDFVQNNPVAAMHATRPILNATDFCAQQPERAAQMVVDRGVAPRYDYTLRMVQELPRNWWHEYDPQNSLRFYGLRLREAGMVRSNPEQLLA